MPPRKRAYHHGDLRRAMMDAATAYAAESGSADDVTVRELARRAGVSHTAPYRHFRNREEILAAVAEEGFAELAASMRSAKTGLREPEERFVRSGLAYLRFAESRGGYLAIMFGPEIAKNQTRALQRSANEAFTAAEDLAIEAGFERGQEARRAATVIWSFLHGLATLESRGQVPPSVNATADELAAIGLRHLFRAFRSVRRQKKRTTPARSR